MATGFKGRGSLAEEFDGLGPSVPVEEAFIYIHSVRAQLGLMTRRVGDL